MNNNEEIFSKMPVWKAIGSLAVPSILMIVVMIFYNMADMFFVGMLGDTAQVAAVSLISPVFSVTMALGSMLGSGACILIAQVLGAGDRKKAEGYSALTAWWSIILGVIVLAAGTFFRSPLLLLLGSNEEIYPYAQSYLTILLAGAPFMIFSTAFGSIVRAEGAIKEGMVGYLASTLLNMLLDPLFILGLHMGVGGAALATVLANAASSIYLLLYIHSEKSCFTVAPGAFLENPKGILKIAATGLPNAASTMLAGFASVFANQFLVSYGTDAVAAMAAASKATLMIAMVQMGITMGVQPMLAYCYGAGDADRLKETLRKLAALTIGVGTAVTLFCLLEGRTVVGLFLKQESALALGQEMIRLLVVSGPILGVYYLSTTYLQTVGKAAAAAFASVLRQGILLLPLLFVMNYFFAVKGNICANVAADYASAGIVLVLMLRAMRSEHTMPVQSQECA